MSDAYKPPLHRSPADAHAAAVGAQLPGRRGATAQAQLVHLHDACAQRFCQASARLTELWHEECAHVADAGAHLQDGALRRRLTDELTALLAFCRTQREAEESLLRAAGMRRFADAWMEHKLSHSGFIRRLAGVLDELDRDSPGCLAREAAALVEDYWSVHSLDHDQLALSLIRLLPDAPWSQSAAPRN